MFSIAKTSFLNTKLARLFFIYSLANLPACTSSALFFVNELARFGNYQVIENIAYGPDKLNRLSIYKPDDLSEKKSSVIIFFYGGCWGGCKTFAKEDYLFIAQALTSYGYIVVLADYRLYPEVKFPQIMDDTGRTVEWVKKNIERHNGDPKAIFLMGHSAGAHLAAMLTLNEKYLKPETYESIKGFIGLAGPYDFLPLTKPYQKAVFGPEEKYPESQPINFVDGAEPPLLLLYGKQDKTVKPHNIKNLAGKVRQLGGSVETRVYDDLDHTGILEALTVPLQNHEPVLSDIVEFIEKNISAQL